MACTAGFYVSAQNGSSSSAKSSSEAKAPFNKCWEYMFENTVRRSIASTNGTVYLSEGGGKVRAISAKSGQVLWVTELGGEISTSLAIPKVGLAIVTTRTETPADQAANSTLRLLNFDTGLVRFTIPAKTAGETYLGLSGSHLILTDSVGSISVFDIETGNAAWKLNLGGRVTAAPAYTPLTFAVASEKKIDVVSVANGAVTATIKTDQPVTSLEIRENEMIVAGDDRGYVTNFRDNSGAVWWRFKSGARIGTITETKEGILVGSFDNFLYMISKYSGDVKWKRRMEGRLVNEPFVSGDVAFTSVSVEETAAMIDLDNGKIIEQIGLGENRYAITAPVLTEGSILVFSVPEALIAFSNSGCTTK